MTRTNSQIIAFYAGVTHEATKLNGPQYEAVRMAIAFACAEVEDNAQPAFSKLHDQWADANNELVRLRKTNEEQAAEIERLAAKLQNASGAVRLVTTNTVVHPATITPNGTHPTPEAGALTVPPAHTQPPGRRPFDFQWTILDDVSRQLVTNLDEGNTAWRTITQDDKRAIVLCVITELQLELPPGETLSIEQFESQRPIWMAGFPSVSNGLGMTWKQLQRAATSA